MVKVRNDCFYRSNAIKVPIGTNNWDVKTYRNKLKNVLTDESKMFDSGWGYAVIVLKRSEFVWSSQAKKLNLIFCGNLFFTLFNYSSSGHAKRLIENK